MTKVCGLVLACLTAAAQQHAILGNLTSTGSVAINGVAIPASVSPSLPVTDQDQLENTGSALLITAEGNRLTLDANSRAKVSTVEDGQTFLYVSGGGVEFQIAARHVYICIGKRLFVPATPSRGFARLAASGKVTTHIDRGTFLENGRRGCTETGIEGFVTGLLTGAGAVAGAPAAGGIATGTAAAGAGIGTLGTVAVVAGTAAGLGGAAASGLASSSSVSDCTGNIGCNFNPPPPSPSQP